MAYFKRDIEQELLNRKNDKERHRRVISAKHSIIGIGKPKAVMQKLII